MALRLIILGLRRSGTTIFWQTFLQDTRLTCYDEPFNRLLYSLPDRGVLKHPEEFVELLRRDPVGFWETFAPINFTEELQEGLSDRQQEWLRYVGRSSDRVAVDVTRCHFKIEALKAVAPEAVLVYLYRPPAAYATSHLLPTGKEPFIRLRRWLRPRSFWVRTGNYASWGVEQMVGRTTLSLFAHRLAEIELEPEEIYRLPAVGKLLASWRLNVERARRDGLAQFGDRFLPVNFDEFCSKPQAIVERVYRALEMDPPELDYRRIHPANRPHQADSTRWAQALRGVGLSPDADPFGHPPPARIDAGST